MSTEVNARPPASKRRILLIIPYGGVGGMERLALHLYRHYRSLGDTVKVIKLVRLPDDFITFGDDEIALSERDLVAMPAWRRFAFYLSIPLSIARVVREHAITHSIGFGDMGNLFSSLSPSREFKVASIHSLKSIELSSPTLLNRLFRLAYRSSYRRFDRVVCISKAIRKDLLTKCGYAFPQNLDVIYNPHDVSGIRQASVEALDPSEESLFSTRTVVFLGRLTAAKAPWHLIRAFNQLLARGMKARLLFVGDGDPDVTRYLHDLVRQFGIDDQVVFLGRRANPYKYLARADVLALSSHFEGTPNVIVEAVALGVPVVSSHCTDGIVELMSTTEAPPGKAPFELAAGIVTPPLLDGQVGIPHDTTTLTQAELELTDALEKILRSPKYRATVRNEQGSLLQKFDLARSAQAYLDPLREGRLAQ